MFRCIYIIFRECFLIYLKLPSQFISHHTNTVVATRKGTASTRQTYPDFIDRIYNHKCNILYIAFIKTWYILQHFNDYNLLIICNNHLGKHFNFINCIDFVTLACIRKAPWRWCQYIETCRSDLWNYITVNILCISWSK